MKNKKLNNLILEIACEAHIMGRIYNRLGEPETPAEVYEEIERMISRKMNSKRKNDGYK